MRKVFMFNVVKDERKALVTAIGEIMTCTPKYCGAPSFRYVVGDCTVSKEGTLTFEEDADPDSINDLLARLVGRGFAYEIRRDDELAGEPEGNGGATAAANELAENGSGAQGFEPCGITDGLEIGDAHESETAEPEDSSDISETKPDVFSEGTAGDVHESETAEPEDSSDTSETDSDKDFDDTADDVHESETAELEDSSDTSETEPDKDFEDTADDAHESEAAEQEDSSDTSETEPDEVSEDMTDDAHESETVEPEDSSDTSEMEPDEVSEDTADDISESGAAESEASGNTPEAEKGETRNFTDDGQAVIGLPLGGFSQTALDNLEMLIAGKATLIRKALGEDLHGGAVNLPIERTEVSLDFPWLRSGVPPEHINAWSLFISALCATAKKQKRVIMKERAVDEQSSEKYAFRCFLLKLGFIGTEYKQARSILLSHLTGNGSHKTGDGKKPAPYFTGAVENIEAAAGAE